MPPPCHPDALSGGTRARVWPQREGARARDATKKNGVRRLRARVLRLHRERAAAAQVGVQVHRPVRPRRVPRSDARGGRRKGARAPDVPRVRGAVPQRRDEDARRGRRGLERGRVRLRAGVGRRRAARLRDQHCCGDKRRALALAHDRRHRHRRGGVYRHDGPWRDRGRRARPRCVWRWGACREQRV